MLKYQYKKKTYNRIIEVSDGRQSKYKKIDIRVCRLFPRIIYIEKERRNNQNEIGE